MKKRRSREPVLLLWEEIYAVKWIFAIALGMRLLCWIVMIEWLLWGFG